MRRLVWEGDGQELVTLTSVLAMNVHQDGLKIPNLVLAFAVLREVIHQPCVIQLIFLPMEKPTLVCVGELEAIKRVTCGASGAALVTP